MEFHIDVVCRLSLKNKCNVQHSWNLGFYEKGFDFVCVVVTIARRCFGTQKYSIKCYNIWNCFRYNLLKVGANCEAWWIINIPKCLRANYNEHSSDIKIYHKLDDCKNEREEILKKVENGMEWEARIKSLFLIKNNPNTCNKSLQWNYIFVRANVGKFPFFFPLQI